MERVHYQSKCLFKSDQFRSLFLYHLHIKRKAGKQMKKGLTELVFILDRSGSMAGLESDTIGGFNGMIKKQQKEGGEVNITTVFFDNEIEIIHDRFPLSVVQPLTEEDYYVRGTTALLDAVGSAVKKMENIQKRLPEDMKAEKILFIIITDGMENASREYTAKMVKSMIEKEQEQGWQFVFLGANIDSVEEAEKIGIRRSHAANYKCDSKGVGANFATAGSIMKCMSRADCTKEEIALAIPEFLKNVRENGRENKER